MTNHDYPHTGYGVEARAGETGWVLLGGVCHTRSAATKVMQALTGQHGFGADDIRVVALTITRKEDTE